MHIDYIWSDHWFLNDLFILFYCPTGYYQLSWLCVLIFISNTTFFCFLFNIKYVGEKTQWFPRNWFLDCCLVICKLGLSYVIYSGVDTIAESRISFRFCCSSHLPLCWYIFFMLFKNLCSKEDLLHNHWSIPIVFIWSSRRGDCNITLITTHCCSNTSIERIE